MKWETFTLFWSKFIRETVYQISSESHELYRRYYKKIGIFFWMYVSTRTVYLYERVNEHGAKTLLGSLPLGSSHLNASHSIAALQCTAVWWGARSSFYSSSLHGVPRRSSYWRAYRDSTGYLLRPSLREYWRFNTLMIIIVHATNQAPHVLTQCHQIRAVKRGCKKT